MSLRTTQCQPSSRASRVSLLWRQHIRVSGFLSFFSVSGNHLYFKNFIITVQFIHLDILVFIRFCDLILAVTINNEYRVKVFSIECVNDVGPLAEFIVMSG